MFASKALRGHRARHAVGYAVAVLLAASTLAACGTESARATVSTEPSASATTPERNSGDQNGQQSGAEDRPVVAAALAGDAVAELEAAERHWAGD